MKTIHGVSASKGIAIGKLSLNKQTLEKVLRHPVTDINAEVNRLIAARTATERTLRGLHQKALRELGEEDSLIFQIHLMLLEDHDYFDSIKDSIVQNKVNAEYAVWMVSNRFYLLFSQMENEYMRARGDDILDISQHLLRYLNPAFAIRLERLSGRGIIAAADLLPSEAVRVDRKRTLAFVTRDGSQYSHAAILLRTMGIPYVVGLGEGFDELIHAECVIVDGSRGDVILDPDPAALHEYEERERKYQEHQKALRELKGCPAITKDGYRIGVHANIGHAEDVDLALENDADGIGLFRTEFLYLGSNANPTEDGQFEAYRKVLQQMKGKRVIIRTLDVGEEPGTSQWRYRDYENPILGIRAIRSSLQSRGVFMTQLRAILRASIYGKVAIMFPVITSEQEILDAKRMVRQAREELEAEGVPVAERIELGAMIETPASVIISDLLARHVDFFSIGTNDLTQYTLAMDRNNPAIAPYYNLHHPAVMRMIRIAVENAKKNGIWTSICGESASDPQLTQFYLSLGVDELSVAPSAVLEIRRAVRKTTLAAVQEETLHKFCGEDGQNL